jgi:hypothetical protein
MSSNDYAVQPAFYTVREEMPMRTIKLDSPERRCPCGALRESGMKRCRKCRSRSRWRRRKSTYRAHSYPIHADSRLTVKGGEKN